MADAILLFIAMILVLGGIGAIGYLIRRSAWERTQLPGKITRKREKALNNLDKLIKRIDQASTIEELDSLEEEKRRNQ